MAVAIPFVLAAAAVTSTVVGLAAANSSAQGQIAAGNAQQQADVAQAKADSSNADQQMVQGTQQRNIQISKGAEDYVSDERAAGAVRAAYGGAGVAATSGTPLSVMADAATQNEMTRQMDVWQGLVDQQANDTQAQMDTAQGQSAVQAGYTAQQAGYTSAAGTMLAGTAKAAGQVPGDITAIQNLSW